MKLSALAEDIQTVYRKKEINQLDILELYKEGFLSTEECNHIINKGGKKYGIRTRI